MCTVKDISKDCGFHRTNIYDVLEQLKEKGLITFFKEGKTMKYRITNPNNLYEFLREKKELLDKIFPEIEQLHNFSSEEIQVEVSLVETHSYIELCCSYWRLPAFTLLR